MRRRGEQERLGTGNRYGNKKYEPPADPLELETRLTTIQPTTAWQHSRMIEVVDQMIESAKNENGGAGGPEVNALLLWKHNFTLENAKDHVKQEFVRDFWGWLLGRGKAKDHDLKVTPWGRASLTDDPEVQAYVDSFYIKMHEFRVKLQLLRMRRPIGINQVYLFFKYIVRGAEVDMDNFLADWNMFVEQFDKGKERYGNEHRQPGMGPHETAPYGNARTELAKTMYPTDAVKELADRIISGVDRLVQLKKTNIKADVAEKMTVIGGELRKKNDKGKEEVYPDASTAEQAVGGGESFAFSTGIRKTGSIPPSFSSHIQAEANLNLFAASVTKAGASDILERTKQDAEEAQKKVEANKNAETESQLADALKAQREAVRLLQLKDEEAQQLKTKLSNLEEKLASSDSETGSSMSISSEDVDDIADAADTLAGIVGQDAANGVPVEEHREQVNAVVRLSKAAEVAASNLAIKRRALGRDESEEQEMRNVARVAHVQTAALEKAMSTPAEPDAVAALINDLNATNDTPEIVQSKARLEQVRRNLNLTENTVDKQLQDAEKTIADALALATTGATPSIRAEAATEAVRAALISTKYVRQYAQQAKDLNDATLLSAAKVISADKDLKPNQRLKVREVLTSLKESTENPAVSFGRLMDLWASFGNKQHIVSKLYEQLTGIKAVAGFYDMLPKTIARHEQLENVVQQAKQYVAQKNQEMINLQDTTQVIESQMYNEAEQLGKFVRQKVDKAREVIDVAQNRVEDMSTELQALQEANTNLEETLKTQQLAMATLQEEIDRLTAELGTEQDLKDAAIQEAQKLADDVTLAKDIIGQFDEQIAKQKKILDDQNEALRKIGAERDAANEEKKMSLNDIVSQAETRRQLYQQQLDALERDRQRAQSEQAEKIVASQKARDKVASVTASVDAVKSRISETRTKQRSRKEVMQKLKNATAGLKKRERTVEKGKSDVEAIAAVLSGSDGRSPSATKRVLKESAQVLAEANQLSGDESVLQPTRVEEPPEVEEMAEPVDLPPVAPVPENVMEPLNQIAIPLNNAGPSEEDFARIRREQQERKAAREAAEKATSSNAVALIDEDEDADGPVDNYGYAEDDDFIDNADMDIEDEQKEKEAVDAVRNMGQAILTIKRARAADLKVAKATEFADKNNMKIPDQDEGEERTDYAERVWQWMEDKEKDKKAGKKKRIGAPKDESYPGFVPKRLPPGVSNEKPKGG